MTTRPNAPAHLSARPLSGRTALITGGARGIGAAVTRTLAGHGADPLITYRSDAGTANHLARSCQDDQGVRACTIPFDMTSPAGPEELLGAVGDEVDVLIVNAAAPYPKEPLPRLGTRALTDKVGQDLRALHQLVTGLVPGMTRRGFGRVVVIGSLHADGPYAPGMAANGVSKAALAAYVEFAVDELTGPGVTINTVHPGYVATEASAHLPSAVTDQLEELTPVRRGGRPDDVAAVVAMLCSPDAGFVSGARVPVAGGLNHPVSLRRILAPAPGPGPSRGGGSR